MNKTTYYLWKNDFSSIQEYEAAKKFYRELGFRVVCFQDGSTDNNIHDALKAVIKNHLTIK